MRTSNRVVLLTMAMVMLAHVVSGPRCADELAGVERKCCPANQHVT